MSIGNSFIRDLSTVEMMFVIVMGWTLVALWQRTIDNLTFNVMRLNKNSTYHTFVIALVITVLFLIFILSFNSVTADIVESDIPGIHPPEPPSPPQPPINIPSELTSIFDDEVPLDNFIRLS